MTLLSDGEGLDFRWGEVSPRAFREVAKLQGTNGDTDEAQDFDLMGFAQATDVTVAPFIQQDLQPSILFTFSQEGGAFGREEAVIRADAGFESRKKRGVGLAVDLDVVGFVQMSGGVGDAVAPGGVVGEKQQAFAGLVEPANGEEVSFGRALKACENGGSAFFI